jgi:hypothetical protein
MDSSPLGLARHPKKFPAISFSRVRLGNLQLNQDINFFPKQHDPPSETCNVSKVFRAGLTLAQSVWV